jgi:hypothetical protein
MVSAAMKTPDKTLPANLVDSSERTCLKNGSIRLVFTCSSKAISKALSVLDGGRKRLFGTVIKEMRHGQVDEIAVCASNFTNQ